MKLLEYIAGLKEEASKDAAGKDGNNKEFGRCLGSMSAWLEERASHSRRAEERGEGYVRGDRRTEDYDVDILRAVDSDFVDAYADYVWNRHEGGALSAGTKKKHLVAFRTIVRTAIADGLLPAIDVFPQVVAKYCGETGTRAPYRPRIHCFAGILERLRKIVFAEDPADVRVLPYIVAMLCGVEIADLFEVTEVPVLARIIAERYNAVNPENPILQGTPGDVKGVMRNLRNYLFVNQLSLMKEGRVSIDLLALAKEQGAPDDLVMQAAREISAGNLTPTVRENLLRYGGVKIFSSEGLEPLWHVLVSCSTRLRGNRLREAVLAAVADYGLQIDARHIYNPIDLYGHDKKGRNGHGAVNRYLFFKSDFRDTLRLNRAVEGTYVLKIRGTEHFATVSEQEIRLLQEMLRDFRDEVMMIDSDEWMRLHSMRLVENAQVRILDGPLRGRMATIVDVPKKGKKLYRLQIAQGCLNFVLSLEGIKLEPTAAEPQK